MSLPDGVRAIIPTVDVFRMSDVRTVSIPAGGREDFVVETPVGQVWEVLNIGFWVGGIAAAVGNHVLEAVGYNTTVTDAIILRMFRVEVAGTVAFPFSSVPLVAAASIISKLPDSDIAILYAVRTHIIGRDVGINNRLTVTYHNLTNLAQTGIRRYHVVCKRMMEVAI